MKFSGSTIQFLCIIFCSSLHAQWHSLGPNGGNVSDLTYADGSFWAATDAGIFQSTDGGLSWLFRPSTLPSTYKAVRIGVSDGRVFTVFNGPYFPPRYMVTSDGGNSWTEIPLTPDSEFNKKLYGYDTTCYALTTSNLWRLDNLKFTWSLVKVPTQANGLTNIEHSDHALYLIALNGVWRKQDGDTAWTSISIPSGTIGLFHSYNDHLWFLDRTGGLPLQTSIDQGQSWQNTSWNTSATTDMTQIIWLDAAFYGIRGYNVAKSMDGTHWDFPAVGPPPYLDGIAGGEGIIVCRGTGGFFRSANGGISIESANEGFVGTTIKTMEVHDGAVYIPTISKRDPITGLWESVHSGLHLVSINSLTRFNGYSFAVATSDSKFHSIVRSSTDWVTYETVATRTGNDYGRFMSSGLQLYTVLNGITCLAHRLDNDGANPVNITANLTAQLGVYVNSLAPVGNDVVAISKDNLQTLYISHDRGEVWESLESTWTPVPSTSYFPEVFNVDDILFASIGDIFYRTEDHGSNWSLANAGLPQNTGHINDIISAGTHFLLASENGGVYISEDKGKSWQEFNAGMGQVSTQDLQVDDDYVYVATSGHGVWRIGIEQLTAIEKNYFSEDGITIFPNPAHSGFYVTTLDKQPVTGVLMIYNISGQLMSSGKLEKNSFFEIGNQLSKGLHFVQLIRDNKIFCTKLMVE